jgi:hypothetical protein
MHQAKKTPVTDHKAMRRKGFTLFIPMLPLTEQRQGSTLIGLDSNGQG